jgi:hypothetical protein
VYFVLGVFSLEKTELGVWFISNDGFVRLADSPIHAEWCTVVHCQYWLKYSQNVLDSDSYCFADACLLTVYLGKCPIRKGQRTTDDMKARLIVVLKGHFRWHHFSIYTWNTARSGKLHNISSSNFFELCSTRFNLVCRTRHESLYPPIWRVWKRFHPIRRRVVSKRHADCSRTLDLGILYAYGFCDLFYGIDGIGLACGVLVASNAPVGVRYIVCLL